MRNTIEQIPQLPARPARSWQKYFLDSLIAVVGALAITGIIGGFHLYPTIPNISIIYLLLILALASTRGRFGALIAALVAFLSFDFFLVPPLYSFLILRWEEWLALLVFLVTALLTSQLAVITRQSVEQARLRERESRILYEMGRVLNNTERLDEQLDTIALAVGRVFSPWGVRECALLLPDKNGTLSIQADAPIRVEHFTLTTEEWAAARQVMSEGKIQGLAPASEEQSTRLRLVPLKASTRIVGVLCLRIEQGAPWSASEEWMQVTQAMPTERAIFFWTFLDEAVMKIEQARVRGNAASDEE
jgi:K+-sensing histidine kinase KdpD